MPIQKKDPELVNWRNTLEGKKRREIKKMQGFHMDPKVNSCNGIRDGGPVIQATGRSAFEEGLGSVDFVLGYSFRMSVHNGLPD
jgi:hypothetical protein